MVMLTLFPMSAKKAEEFIFRLPIRGERALMPKDIAFHLGRYALYHGLQALKARMGNSRTKVLIPSFHCASIVETSLAAGLRCEFYPIRRNGSIGLENLANQLGREVLAIIAIHYYGWPTDLSAMKRMAEEHQIALVEDCAHALFSHYQGEPVGKLGDIAIFSIRKSIPVMDGGILRINRSDLEVKAPKERFPSLKASTSTLIRSLGGGFALHTLKKLRLPTHRKQNQTQCINSSKSAAPQPLLDFDPNQAKLGISFLSQYVALRVDPTEVVEHRRSSYFLLNRLLEGHPNYTPLFTSLPSGVCPLSLVILHPQRDKVEIALQQKGVEVYTFGRHPHPSMDLERFPETRLLCEQSLALPIHQQLSDKDIERMAEIIKDVI